MERSNGVRMNSIGGKEQIYTAYDGGSISEQTQREKMLSNMMAPKRLVLKEGAQVRTSLTTSCGPFANSTSRRSC